MNEETCLQQVKKEQEQLATARSNYRIASHDGDTKRMNQRKAEITLIESNIRRLLRKLEKLEDRIYVRAY